MLLLVYDTRMQLNFFNLLLDNENVAFTFLNLVALPLSGRLRRGGCGLCWRTFQLTGA